VPRRLLLPLLHMHVCLTMLINIGECIHDHLQVTIFRCAPKHESMLYNMFTFEVMYMAIPTTYCRKVTFIFTKQLLLLFPFV